MGEDGVIQHVLSVSEYRPPYDPYQAVPTWQQVLERQAEERKRLEEGMERWAEQSKRETAEWWREGEERFRQEAIVEANRSPCAISGFKIGIIVGGMLFVMTWIIHEIWKVPFWNSLASLVDGALPAAIIAGMLAWRTNKVRRQFTYKVVLFGYLLAGFIGAMIGAIRWEAGSQWSIAGLVGKAWSLGIDYSAAVLFAMGLFIIWLNGKLKRRETSFQLPTDSDFYDTWGFIITIIICFLLYSCAVLIDAFHFTPWVLGNVQGIANTVNRAPWLFALLFPSVAGALFGYLLPDRYHRW